MRRAFGHDTLGSVRMTSIYLGVGVGFIQPPSVGEEIAEPPASGTGSEGTTGII